MTKNLKSPELIYPFKRKVGHFNEWQVWGTCPYNCEAVVGIRVSEKPALVTMMGKSLVGLESQKNMFIFSYGVPTPVN